jgi:hypothetical protein
MLEVPDIADYGFPAQPEYEVRLKHAGGPLSPLAGRGLG